MTAPLVTPSSERNWLGHMATLMVGTMAVLLSATTVNVAIVPIMKAFGVGLQTAQLLSTIFLGATVVTAPLAIWLTRRIGAYATFQGVLALYAVASLDAALSPSFPLLIAARLVQGGCAGIIQPLAMFLLLESVVHGRRGRAMSAYGFGVVLAPAIGPTLAGWCIAHIGLGSTFLIGLPLSLLANVLARSYLGHLHTRPKPQNFDWAGLTLLSTLVSLVLLYPVLSKLSTLWGGLTLAAGALNIFLLLRVETGRAAPLVAVKLFASPGFRRIALISVCYGIGMYGGTFLVPIYLQGVVGMSAEEAGNMMFAGGIALAATILISGHWVDRYGGRKILLSGLVVFALSCLMLAFECWRASTALVAIGVALGRVGLGLIIPSLSTSVVHEISHEHLREGSSSMNLLRQMGGAVGISGLAALLAGAPHWSLFEQLESGARFAGHTIHSAGFGLLFVLFAIATISAAGLRKS